MKGEVRLIRDNREQLKANLRAATAQATAEEAQAVADDAKATVAVDTGETRDSIKAKKVGPSKWAVTVGGAGVYLEFGTVKMAARPFLFPALQRARVRLAQRVKDNFRRMK